MYYIPAYLIFDKDIHSQFLKTTPQELSISPVSLPASLQALGTHTQPSISNYICPSQYILHVVSWRLVQIRAISMLASYPDMTWIRGHTHAWMLNKHGYSFWPLLKASLLLPSGHTGHWQVQCGGTCMYVGEWIVLISAYHLTHDVIINCRSIELSSSPIQGLKKLFPRLLIWLQKELRPAEDHYIYSLISRSPPTPYTCCIASDKKLGGSLGMRPATRLLGTRQAL